MLYFYSAEGSFLVERLLAQRRDKFYQYNRFRIRKGNISGKFRRDRGQKKQNILMQKLLRENIIEDLPGIFSVEN